MKKVTIITKKKKYDDGTKKIDNYTRETTKKELVKPGSKGKLYIKEGTVQRKSVGQGVEFVPKENEKDISNTKGKIIDPKSRKIEVSGQASLRKATQEVYKGVDISKSKKEGEYITYDTAKGKQVAGRVEKTPDILPEYKVSKQREVEVSRKGDVVPRLTGTKEQQIAKRKELESQGYKKQAGTYAYIKDDESKFVPETEVEKYKKEGYNKSGAINKKNAASNTLAKGAKKMKIYKKGSKMC